MAAATDKARFYLEKYVPELQEYERKEIFSRDEIQAIAAKRSDFEHILNARGSTTSDYARYATYEMNLDSLRKKRCQRRGIKNATVFNGQRTVFFIMDRATKKFPGDTGLWMQYISYCQKQKAEKRLSKVFTSVLRLKPTEWGLWVLAVKHYAETQGDMDTARSYMQRGLRFCKNESRMYLEYLKLEMVYLSKLAARRRILGLDEEIQAKKITGSFDDGDDVVALPDVTSAELDDRQSQTEPETEGDQLAIAERLANAPAYKGAIPIAIFDAAMKQFQSRPDVALSCFDLAAYFVDVAATATILEHILGYLKRTAPTSPATVICDAGIELYGVDLTAAEFPIALGKALATLKKGLAKASDPQLLAEKAARLLLPFAVRASELDDAVSKVVDISLRRYLRLMSEGQQNVRVEALVSALRRDGRSTEADVVLEFAGE